MILAGEDRYHHPDLGAAEAVVWRFWRHHPGSRVTAALVGQPKGPWPEGEHPNLTADAYVNHGRWCVDCPHGCGSAQYASRKDRRFFCVDCDNAGDPRWIPVDWPSDLEIGAIEAALLARPDVTSRNWKPGETIEQLVAENAEHDLPPAAVLDKRRP